ncbi:MAG TPA: nucleoside monophosphate kinase [Candidatus Paceibacterota bacterium]|nr:nucleoside monophosphate kinase [Candidatus Paceibacterota bacterium]
MESPQTVFFLGKPGSGKGTQAKILAARTGWPMYGSGDQFRAIAAEDTPAGRRTRLEMDQGLLSPPWFVEYLYLRIALSHPDAQSVIFDGFNRKIEEAELIFAASEFLERPFTVINIAISDEEVHRRLDSRKGESGRADDHCVQMRLDEYNRFTEKALEVFRKGNACVDIDGERTPEEVSEEVAKILGLA